MTQNEINSSGLKFWSGESAPGSSPEVDIVAVQGLGAHPYWTWVKRAPAPRKRALRRFWVRESNDAQGEDGEHGLTGVMWPRDLLMPLFKNARIATYSYESDWRDRRVATSLRECGQQLLEVLFQHRREANERQRPLVLIGHSLGCLVIQQALVLAISQREHIDLPRSVAGLIFLGAPIQGSDAARYGNWLAQVVRFAHPHGSRYTLLETLCKDSTSLHALSVDFWGPYQHYDIVCFYENREADYGPLSTQFVSKQSATLVGKRMIYLDADHSGLNKFSGKEDKNFKLLLPEIQRMVKCGPSAVADRYRTKDANHSGNVHWIVRGTVQTMFAGRSELLDRIQTAFRVEKATGIKEQKRFVITGLAGQGKSEVCLKIANLMREEFWGVFWVDVGTPSTAKNDFIAVAKALGSSEENIDDILLTLANTKRSWLLILDNADDPKFDYKSYLPSGTRGAVIITSRVSSCSQFSTVGWEALEGLDLEHATQLLLKAAKLPDDAWPLYDPQAKDIVQCLGSHTLALIQAGSYIAEGYCRLDQYPAEYQRQRKRLLKYYPDQGQSRYRDVYATFEASADVLRNSDDESGKDALDLLAILSMLHSSILRLEIFETAWISSRQTRAAHIHALKHCHVLQLPDFMAEKAGEWDDYRLKKASSRLASHSLVTRHDLDGLDRLSMHPLTHAWAKDRQSKKQQQEAWISAGSILAFLSLKSEMWLPYGRELQPHVQSYLSLRFEDAFSYGPRDMVVPILLRSGWILLLMSDYSRVAALLGSLYNELDITPSNPSNGHMPIWDLAARNMRHIGDYRQAVELLEYVVKTTQSFLTETDSQRLISEHELACAYIADGQINQAIELLEHVVKIRKTKEIKTHPDQLLSQVRLACAYRKTGQIKQAINLLEYVVEILETSQILAETHMTCLTAKHDLGVAYFADRQYKRAIKSLKDVVNIRKTILAETNPARLASEYSLAAAYRADGQIPQAIELLEHVVKINKIMLDETDPFRRRSEKLLSRCASKIGS